MIIGDLGELLDLRHIIHISTILATTDVELS